MSKVQIPKIVRVSQPVAEQEIPFKAGTWMFLAMLAVSITLTVIVSAALLTF